jgi:manganese/iron transport system substrate-binding protein
MIRPPFLVLLCLALLGCKPASPKPKGGPKRILTTFTIIQDMAQNVAGTVAIVESITKPSAEIHDYEPTPLDLVKAQDADLVLWNGLGLERWFEKFLQQVNDVPSVVLTDGIEPMGIGEGPYSSKPNPHSWMSPANAVIYVENIRKALVKLDPANEATYTKNAAAYTAELRAVDEPVRKALQAITADQRWLVSCEGAFSYLTRNRCRRSWTPCAQTKSRSCSRKAPSATKPCCRWRRKPVRATAACCMWTRSPVTRALRRRI